MVVTEDRAGSRRPTGSLSPNDSDMKGQRSNGAATEDVAEKAKRYGLDDSYNDTVREAGFATRDELFKTVNAVVEGTFSIPVTVEVEEGNDLINHVDVRAIREKLRW